ncbi:MAG: GNAT family N-acetyltransferase [Bacteroidia bacterium]|nr:GNAT family N-acetyltransferase [Bacteroidia bacterium]
MNNKIISDNIINIPYIYLEEDAIARFNFVLQGFKNEERYVFAITQKTEDELIGEIGIHLDSEHNRAEIGYWIGEPFWGLGIATEAVGAILKFGFEELLLNKIHATHYVDNPASGKVLANNKMILEAELKDQYKMNDDYKSVYQYRLTRSEYLDTL